MPDLQRYPITTNYFNYLYCEKQLIQFKEEPQLKMVNFQRF